MYEPTHEITELLDAWSNGDNQALDKLVPLVDRELKKIAQHYMRNERAGHILQTTALVNEALIKLIRENLSFENRKHFYGLVAKRMRQVLIDYARKQSTAKRGKHARQVELSEVKDKTSEKFEELRMLGEALTELARIDELKVNIVECHFFIGLTFDETAKVLDIPPNKVQSEWRFARAWLKSYMSA
jgi:RNA polymerase sigma factor (TIGR02999 family)